MNMKFRHFMAWVGVPVLILTISFTVAQCAQPSVAVETRRIAPRRLGEAVSPEIETIETSFTAMKARRMLTPVPEPSPSFTSGARIVTATGYCSCAVCCGTADGITASGAKASWGTIAASRAYPFGSKFTISGLNGTFVVQDRGGAISGDRIDIWFPSHAEALEWGRRAVTLTPIE